MVMEAVYIKVQHEDAELREQAQKEAEREAFKKDKSNLDHLR
jgi:hypothetical protein